MTGRLIVTPMNADNIFSQALSIKDPLLTGFNLPPRNFISIIRTTPDKTPELCNAYWGYTPQWMTVLTQSPYLVRKESLSTKPMFRDALQSRCLIPVSGYYEWKSYTRHKRPFAVRRPENRTFFLAGITSYYATSRQTGYLTFALLTQPSNTFIATLTERMPVIISREHAENWLNNRNLTEQLLVPPPDDYLDYYPVAHLVNNPANKSRTVAEPTGNRLRCGNP